MAERKAAVKKTAPRQRGKAATKEPNPAPVAVPEVVPAPMLISDLSEEQQVMVNRAVALAKQGPTILRRRGSRIPVQTWKAPEHIAFEHPEHGVMQVNVVEGVVYKEDLPEEQKKIMRATARLIRG